MGSVGEPGNEGLVYDFQASGWGDMRSGNWDGVERRSAEHVSTSLLVGELKGRLSGVETKLSDLSVSIRTLDEKLDAYTETVNEAKAKWKVYTAVAGMGAGLISFLTGLNLDSIKALFGK